jgi:hypothetical protein
VLHVLIFTFTLNFASPSGDFESSGVGDLGKQAEEVFLGFPKA